MRAMAITAYGGPLQLVDLPDPDVPHGHALLRVLACGVCATDVKTARGRMPFSAELELPHVPGHEVVGEVLETNPPGLLGAGTRAIVYQYWPCGRCGPCGRGDEQLCTDLVGWLGFVHPGGFRELLTAPIERLIPVPDGIEAAAAAPLSCAIGTSVRAVMTRGEVTSGDRVVVIGLGGVGIHVAQIAAAVGARVIGLDVHAPTLEMAGSLGLDARAADGDATTLRDALDGEGADIAIDAVGTAETIALAAEIARPGGRIVGVGHSAGAAGPPLQRVVLQELELVGSRYASLDEMARGVAMVAEGSVRPVIGMLRRLEQANEVLDALEAGRVVGRAVLELA